MKKITDAIDVETFFSCSSQDEGEKLMRALMERMGFEDSDIVFIEHSGIGARVRGRGYINRPADKYGWLEK